MSERKVLRRTVFTSLGATWTEEDAGDFDATVDRMQARMEASADQRRQTEVVEVEVVRRVVLTPEVIRREDVTP